MDYYVSKLLQGVVGGALFSGSLATICVVYINYTSTSSDSLSYVARNLWWLEMLYAGFFGLVAGGILGGVISLLNLSLITAGICGFLITAIPVIFLIILNYNSPNDAANDLRRFGVFLIAITTLTAIFVSYTQMVFFKSK